MLRTMTKTTIATFIAATFSVGAVAADQQQQRTQQQQQQEREWQERQQERGQERRNQEQHANRYGQQDQRNMGNNRNTRNQEFAEVLENNQSYSRFAEAWEASGIEDELDDNTTYTVFVPTNEALGGSRMDDTNQTGNRTGMTNREGQNNQTGNRNAQTHTGSQQAQTSTGREGQTGNTGTRGGYATQTRSGQAGDDDWNQNFQRMIDDDDREGLQELVKQHIVEGEVRSTRISRGGMTEETLNGDDLRITYTNDEMRVNGARVTQADMETANNIIIHRVDSVLTEDQLASN